MGKALRRFLPLLLLLCPAIANATAYSGTCFPRTMHVGDQVPPMAIWITTGSTNAGGGSAIWTTPPTCSTTVTSGSAAGTYTETITAGTLASGTDPITYTNGSIVVIPSDNIGATLVNAFIPNNGATAPPSGWFTSLPWAVKDVTSNQVCTMSAAASDNSDCWQHLMANERGAQTATVKCAVIGGGPTATVTLSCWLATPTSCPSGT